MYSTLIILLDSEHLDHNLFMKSFAQKLTSFKSKRIVLVHGDSSYSKQLVSNGMLETDAKERSIKEINLKLISILADNGIPAIGIHGYQRNTINWVNNAIKIHTDYLNSLPNQVVLILSNIVSDTENSNQHITISSAVIANNLTHVFDDSVCLCFALSEKADLSFKVNKPTQTDLLNMLPEEVLRFGNSFLVTTIADFNKELENSVTI
jgi:isopentenyl phosphate kinase